MQIACIMWRQSLFHSQAHFVVDDVAACGVTASMDGWIPWDPDRTAGRCCRRCQSAAAGNVPKPYPHVAPPAAKRDWMADNALKGFAPVFAR